MQSVALSEEQKMMRVIYKKDNQLPVTVYGTILLCNITDFILYDTDHKNTIRINNSELEDISPIQ
ncbi:hypothetical protein M2444_004780 [Paenibacillus sp. PastF-3]|uniref:hypothetical protein n=1 Tax=unclassified Paenibacillus TaxID=185978 RepID=UPI000BA0C18C|nr:MULTISPECIES: hypothetical protein [unclassified Paenibacillus]MBY3621086.1 hypothetical protein [Acinetobacter sp. CUI P1]MDH6372951.1 hypothetical protein [Paenibacillus sp. PastF-3]OZQ81172.1 hypothetical protein CA598_27025 [Paenibacillus sp. VTT E-133291]